MYAMAMINMIPADTVMLTDAPTIPHNGMSLTFNARFASAARPAEYITTGGIPIEAK
jgi:hypothetical protein